MASVLARRAPVWTYCHARRQLAGHHRSPGIQLVHSASGNGVAGNLDELTPHNDNAKVDSEFSQPPEWVKILAIGLASSLVALIELAVCRRPPFFWAPGFFLLSFIVWRLSLRDVGNSNVPARSPDRLFLIAVTCLIMLWEYTLKRVIMYSPWLCIAIAILLSPSRKEMDYREQYLSHETMMRAEREYLNRVPVTPKESAAWFGRLLSCFWGPFVEPMLLKTAIVPLQEQVEASAPQGWTLALDSFSLGDVAPTLTGWQVYNNAVTGQVEKVTADFSLDSSSLTMGLTGTGPFVGVFVVSLKGISMRGKVQFMPFSSSRLMLFSFLSKPELSVKLNVRGRFIGQQSIPQFAFLRAALVSAIEKDFVEPNRGLVPLDYAPVVGDPLATRITVRILSVSGLTVAEQKEAFFQQNGDDGDSGSLLEQKDGIEIEINNPLQPLGDGAEKVSQSVFSKVVEKVPAASAGAVRVYLKVPEMLLERTSKLVPIDDQGTAALGQDFSFQLAAQQASVELRVSNERGFTVGTARLRMAHLPDGSTGMWASQPGGKAVATRWSVGAMPWKATIEIEGTKQGFMEVECRSEAWQYSLDLSTPRQFRKGLRSVVAVQILEGRDIVSRDFNGLSDPYVLVTYNKRAASTRTVFKSLNPLYGDVLLFQENRSMLARRMRLDVLDRDKNSIRGDEACGWAYANLDLVAEGQVTEQWLQLRGVPSGEVRIRLLVLSGTDDSNEVREEAVRSLEASRVIYTSDAIKCTVVRAEGLPIAARKKPCIIEVGFGGSIQCTRKQKPDIESGAASWSEDFRFRVQDAPESSSQVVLKVKDGSGKGLGLGGSTLGRAILNTSAVIHELDKMRSQQMSSDGTQAASEPTRRRLSPASLLVSGDLSSSTVKPSKIAQKLTVASQQGEGVVVRRTDIVEVWLPLQGAGSDARLLIRIQGSMGENRETARNPFEETARFTQQTIESVKSVEGHGLIARINGFGRSIASALFD